MPRIVSTGVGPRWLGLWLAGWGSRVQVIMTTRKWEFPKIRGTLFWGPLTRILLFRVLY